jgi:hypothetical protein
MSVTKPEAEAISFKTATQQLGVWLNMNKQVNVDSVLTADAPVAVKASLVQLLFKFATDFGLGALNLGPGVGTGLQSTVEGFFGKFGNWISTNITDIFTSPAEAAISLSDSVYQGAAGTVLPSPTVVGNVSSTISSNFASLSTQMDTAVAPKMNALTTWVDGLFDKNLALGDGDFSIRSVYNIFNEPFKQTVKALGLPNATMFDAISMAANFTGQGELTAKLSELQTLAANVANPSSLVQAKLDEVEAQATSLYNEMLGNQLNYANAFATNRVFEETSSIYNNLNSARERKAAAEAAGDQDAVDDIETWLAVYRLGIEPELRDIVDDFITINDQSNAGLTPIPMAAVANTPSNANQVVGNLPPPRG